MKNNTKITALALMMFSIGVNIVFADVPIIVPPAPVMVECLCVTSAAQTCISNTKLTNQLVTSCTSAESYNVSNEGGVLVYGSAGNQYHGIYGTNKGYSILTNPNLSMLSSNHVYTTLGYNTGITCRTSNTTGTIRATGYTRITNPQNGTSKGAGAESPWDRTNFSCY